MKKRYQALGKDGSIVWSNWFTPFNGTERPEVQIKLSRGLILYNEYKD